MNSIMWPTIVLQGMSAIQFQCYQ